MKKKILFILLIFTVFNSFAQEKENQPNYILPFPIGTEYRVIQGNKGKYGHQEHAEFAYDFTMAIGSTVTAARSGKVVKIEENFEDNTKKPGEENYVMIDHGDGTFARYYHLTKNGALVAVGDKINQGDKIGLSGNSGASFAGHLHFDVTTKCFDWGCQTICINFVNSNENPLMEGKTYKALSIVQNNLQQNSEKAQVMLLGTYHFANPNADLVKSNFPDHLSEKKQKEISEVLDLLAKFKPNKIVVEATPENTKIQNNYQEYLKNNYKLTANETDQIGFRLAKQFGHQKIYPADHQLGMDFDALMAAANETKNIQFLQYFQAVMIEAQAIQTRHAQISVKDALTELNEPLFQEKLKDFYLQMARVRSKEKFVGADVLASWYQRNFRIFTNIVQIIDSPKDRVLVIFGQGHIPYLRDAVKSSPDMQVIEPNDYLKPKY